MHKFLIIRFSSIGDIILTSPVIRNLRKQYPDAQIDYLSKISFSSLLDSNPHLNNKFYFDRNNLSEIIDQLKNEDYDHIIDLHRNLRSKGVIRKLGKPSSSFPKLNIQKWATVNFKKDFLTDNHIVERYLSALKKLSVDIDDKGLEVFIPEKDKVDIHSLSIPSDFVVANIGGSKFTKRLPTSQWLKVFNNYPNIQFVLLGGKEDMNMANDLKSDNIINYCGKINLNQSISIVSQSNAVLSNDTGLMHAAAAFNKPIVSFWGNTIPKFGMTPYKVDQHLIIEQNALACRPCSKIGYDQCPKGHFKCMDNINTDQLKEILQ